VNNDHKLEHLLRSVPLAERDEAYWQQFPKSVLRRIREEDQRSRREERHPRSGFSKWAWSLGLSTALVFGLLVLSGRRTSRLDEPSQAVLACYHELAEFFPHQLEAVLLSANGAEIQLSKAPNVPDSPPLYIRICPPSAPCMTAISFSGGKIKVFGREFEILANGNGGIFLLAGEGVWVSGQTPGPGEGWRFESGWLEQKL
jgi:hypothetical protein